MSEYTEHPAVLETKTRVMVRFPFLTILLVKQELVLDDPACPTCAVDGKRLYVNTEFLSSMPLDQRVFVFGHELFHVQFNHPLRMHYYRKQGNVHGLPFDEETMQIAADHLVNDYCVKGQFGQKPPSAYHDPNLITIEDSLESAYEKYYRHRQGRRPQPQSGNSMGRAPAAGGSDVLKPAGRGASAPTKDMIKAADAAKKPALQAALDFAKSRGKLPGNLTEHIRVMLTPQVLWNETLRSAMEANYGSDVADYTKPARRPIVIPGIFLPSKKGYNLGPGIIAMDSSASVTKEEKAEFFPEASAILHDMMPEAVHLIICDARIQSVDIIDPKQDDIEEIMRDRAANVGGGGGTSFRPPFKYMEEELPEAEWFVYLTDMCAPYPDPVPGLQMIWIATTDRKAPWGETIRIEVRGREA